MNPAASLSRPNAMRTALLCVFLALAFSTTKFLPGMLHVQDAFTALVFLFLVLVYPVLILSRGKIGRLEFYALAIVAIMPALSALMACREFGQPWWYGVLAQRETVLVGCSLIFVHLYRKDALSLADAEKALVWLAWLTLAGNTLASMLLDPLKIGDVAGISATGADGDGAKLLLDTTFIIYGFFYYAFIGMGPAGRSRRAGLFALVFLAYLVFVYPGRSALIAVLASYLFFSVKWRPSQAALVALMKVAAVVILAGCVLYFLPSERLAHLAEKFGDAIRVVVSGKEGDDISANARILEMAIAEPYIERNWLLGSGWISNQWQGGFVGVIGYFHPSDIGLAGVVFQYGLLGLALFSAQLYFFWRYARRLDVKTGRCPKLTNAVKGFLLYLFVNSITTGRYVFLVEQSLFCIALLYCAVYANERQPPARGQA